MTPLTASAATIFSSEAPEPTSFMAVSGVTSFSAGMAATFCMAEPTGIISMVKLATISCRMTMVTVSSTEDLEMTG